MVRLDRVIKAAFKLRLNKVRERDMKIFREKVVQAEGETNPKALWQWSV